MLLLLGCLSALVDWTIHAVVLHFQFLSGGVIPILSTLSELQFAELLQAQVLALHETLQVTEGLLELFQDFRRAVTVARRVRLGVHGVHNYEHSLVLGCLGVE